MENLNKADAKLSEIKDNDVRIVYLPPATVAAIHFVGNDKDGCIPEDQGKEKINELIEKLSTLYPSCRHYGFNHRVDGKHGYERWFTIPDDMEIAPPFVKKQFTGGVYGAYTLDTWDNEWGLLKKWARQNEKFDFLEGDGNKMGGMLEEHLNVMGKYALPGVKMQGHIDLLIPLCDRKEIVEERQRRAEEWEREKLVLIERIKNITNDAVNINLAVMVKNGGFESNYTNGLLTMSIDDDKGSFTTPQTYSLPLKITLRAKTDSTNIRINYGNGGVILNWEVQLRELRIHDIFNEEGYGFKKFGGLNNAGLIPKNEFINIDFILEKDYLAVCVNGEIRHIGTHYEYIKELQRNPEYHPSKHISIAAAWGSVVSVESLGIVEL